MVCKDMRREKETEFQRKTEKAIQRNLTRDLWFGKGVASAFSKSVLAGSVQQSILAVDKMIGETGLKLSGLLSV